MKKLISLSLDMPLSLLSADTFNFMEPFIIHHSLHVGTCGVKKVSMLTHTYPHKFLRKLKVASCNHQADSTFYFCDLIDLMICKLRTENCHTCH